MDFGIARVQADRHLTADRQHCRIAVLYCRPSKSRAAIPMGVRICTHSSLPCTKWSPDGGRSWAIAIFRLCRRTCSWLRWLPSRSSPAIPTALSDIILMAIEKEPAARFQSAEAFRGALASAFPAARDAYANHGACCGGRGVLASRNSTTAAARGAPTARSGTWIVQPTARAQPEGLYMALGTVLTLVVLAAAVIEGPKLMRGGAADAQGVPASQQRFCPDSGGDSGNAVRTSGACRIDAGSGIDASGRARSCAGSHIDAPSSPGNSSDPAAGTGAIRVPPAQAPQVHAAQTAPVAQPAPAPAPPSPPITAATASPELRSCATVSTA